CRVHGAPDVFTTFTCNPKWPEITAALEPGQAPSDRADVVVRVYHMKLAEYLDEIKSGRAFGPIKAVLYTIEFQKHGLPHAHILVWRIGGNDGDGWSVVSCSRGQELDHPCVCFAFVAAPWRC
uniref:Helitron helicase-like domain-containing protein n=1 Tax=Triticum urartu TaxID=4572 RepID=A0A8R7QU32_TRIUA